MEFVVAYGYANNFKKLIVYYKTGDTPYKHWRFPINPLGVAGPKDGLN